MTDSAQPSDRRRGRPTALDISKAAGVSKATVSLVLRNHPSIPKPTHERIMQIARDLGYVYNRGAASLRSVQTRLIGMSVNDLTNPYFAEIAASMEDALTAQNRIVLMSNSGDSVARQTAFASAVREYNADGILIVPATGTDKAFLRQLREWRLPCILVSRSVEGAEADLVQADHRAGMISAVNHLIGLGHRRIGMIGMNEEISTGRERFEGYHQALADAGVAIEPDLALPGAATRDVGMTRMLQLLDLIEPPTAVVCFNDVVAFGAMLGLRARGLTPGQDFSIVGFDDISEAALWRPALTTVAVARKTVGRVAAELLLRRIEDFDAPFQAICLPTELIVRESTGRPAAKTAK